MEAMPYPTVSIKQFSYYTVHVHAGNVYEENLFCNFAPSVTSLEQILKIC